MLLSVPSDVLLLAALLPQLSLSTNPKKENMQAQEKNQKP
jgi:hypothetical protein